MGRPLEHLAGMTGAPLEDVALSIAAEFRPVDVAAAHARIDRLAPGLGALGGLEPAARAARLLAGLGERRGFASSPYGGPESLMLDHVLEVREGHPIALCIVYAAVARRLGFELHLVGTERFVLIADPASRPPVAIDPVPGGRRLPRTLRWLCPHVVGALLLDHLIRRFLERGAIAEAIRAAELRRVLPLASENRAAHERELLALRARLN